MTQIHLQFLIIITSIELIFCDNNYKLKVLRINKSSVMKNFISKILDQPTSQPIFKFVPQIKISPKSTLHLEIQPNDPHTASNIVINAFVSKTNRTIVPIKVQWSRYKLRSDEQYTIQKIPSVVGNTYMCEPSDLCSTILAKVRCLDSSIGGQAQATIGPIRIDAMLKRLIDGALYSQSLLSQVIIVQGQQKFNINFRLGKNIMQLSQIDTQQKLTMPYSLSQPKIQLSPKDPCKVYLRFQQDSNNTVRNWLNKVTGIDKNSKANMNQSSLSMKIPHSNVSALSSKTKLFQKSYTHCINKLQIRFLSRNSRDLFLFTLRAFICKEDMKNSYIMQRIQTLQAFKTEQDYNKFLEFISLKSEIIRLAQICKDFQIDRDNKVKDINNMEESISQMTLTYLKIIQQKSQNQHVDLEQSYSMISMKRQEILGRKNFRQLKNQNQQLKNLIRDLNQQIQLQKFFKKDDNQSMIFNQTTNPFLKKNTSAIINQNQSGSYYMDSPEIRNNQPTHKNMMEISKSYLKVLEENKKLKSKSNSGGKHDPDRSRDIQNLLQSLHQNQQQEKKIAQMQTTIENFKKQIENFKQINSHLQAQNSDFKIKLNTFNSYPISQGLSSQGIKIPLNSSFSKGQYSYLSQSNAQNNSVLSNSYISMNQSMTSQAELNLLQKKLIQLSNLNTKFQSQNTRLRRQRDYFRSLYQVNYKNQQMLPSNDKNSLISNKQNLNQSNLLGSDKDNSMIMRLRQQKEKIQNEKNSLLKKIDSLTRQSNALRPDTALQKKCQELSRQNDKLIEQNQSLQKTIQNLKNFQQLQKKQFINNQNNYRTSSGQNISYQQGQSSSSQQITQKDEQIQKIKKVNSNLINEIKQLRMQIQRSKDTDLDNSRVIQLQNQLDIFKIYAEGQRNPKIFQTQNSNNSSHQKQLNLQNQQLLNQIGQLKKSNQRLKQENNNLELKIKTQTNTIQKLMNQLDHFNRSTIKDSSLDNSFSKKYLTPGSKGFQEEQLEQYKKKVNELQSQLQILKRNSEAVNRSRDLSMSMMGFEEQRLDLYKKQNQALMFENQNLSKMCSKYAKQARQANLQVNKLRQKVSNMSKQMYSDA